MPMGSSKPTVIFFGLTNSLAMFQAIINNIMRDLINIEKVAFFIDDILVGTDMKEGHNEVVEEVLKKMEKNYLYMKLEKYVWKSRRVNFLGVELEPEGVRMKKEKVKDIIKWLVP